jgi:hypothetical protein
MLQRQEEGMLTINQKHTSGCLWLDKMDLSSSPSDTTWLHDFYSASKHFCFFVKLINTLQHEYPTVICSTSDTHEHALYLITGLI